MQYSILAYPMWYFMIEIFFVYIVILDLLVVDPQGLDGSTISLLSRVRWLNRMYTLYYWAASQVLSCIAAVAGGSVSGFTWVHGVINELHCKDVYLLGLALAWYTTKPLSWNPACIYIHLHIQYSRAVQVRILYSTWTQLPSKPPSTVN